MYKSSSIHFIGEFVNMLKSRKPENDLASDFKTNIPSKVFVFSNELSVLQIQDLNKLIVNKNLRVHRNAVGLY